MSTRMMITLLDPAPSVTAFAISSKPEGVASLFVRSGQVRSGQVLLATSTGSASPSSTCWPSREPAQVHRVFCASRTAPQERQVSALCARAPHVRQLIPTVRVRHSGRAAPPRARRRAGPDRVGAGLREAVLSAGPDPVTNRDALEEPVADHRLEARTQRLVGDARPLGELIEAGGATERLTEDEQHPRVTEDVDPLAMVQARSDQSERSGIANSSPGTRRLYSGK